MHEFDWLLVMGGPMNIYEEDKYPWLSKEKRFIRDAIASNKVALGICLGGQLITDVLGGKVRKNSYKEIGWYPISLTPEGQKSRIFKVLPKKFIALHWHGNMFDIQPQALRTAESDGCSNQAVMLGEAVGLQFHLELSMDTLTI